MRYFRCWRDLGAIMPGIRSNRYVSQVRNMILDCLNVSIANFEMLLAKSIDFPSHGLKLNGTTTR